MMRRFRGGYGRVLVSLALMTMLAAPGAAQGPDEDEGFATGADPISPEEYQKLPKLQRFRAYLAPRVDLSDMFPPPSNQGSQPSCVAWASAYAARSYLYSKEIGRRAEKPVDILSPAYIYNSLRAPGPACNSPIPVQRALDFMKEEGVVSLADYPYNEFNCGEPDRQLADKARRFRISDWRAVERVGAAPGHWDVPIALDDIKGALMRGAPVIFAMPVTRAFHDMKAGDIYKTAENRKRNYHAMVVVGYDEDRQAVRVINSWGQDWADGGFGWIDYETFKLLAGEAYALEAPDAKNPPPVDKSPQDKFDRLRTAMSCAAIDVKNVRGVPTVTGFAGDARALEELQKAALAANPATKWQVAHRPWPQCEAELTLALRLSTGEVRIAGLTETGAPRSGDPVVMKLAEKFGVQASTVAAKPYLSIIYLQADGSAVQLYSGKPARDSKGRLSVSIGIKGAAEDNYFVQPPLGNEVMLAIASAQPLFGDDMKTYQTERQFLTALRGKLTTVPRGSVSAAALRVLTTQ